MKPRTALALLATSLLAAGCGPGSPTEAPKPASQTKEVDLVNPTPPASLDTETLEQSAENSPWGDKPEPDSDGFYRFVVGGIVTEPILIEKGPSGLEKFAGKQVRGGSIVAEAVIDIDGTVGEIKLLHGVDPEMDEEVLRSLKEYLFKPATLDGEPVPVRYIMVTRIQVQ